MTSDPERTRRFYPYVQFANQSRSRSSNTDPIVDPEEHESTFVAEDDMLLLALGSIDVFLGPMTSHKIGPYS